VLRLALHKASIIHCWLAHIISLQVVWASFLLKKGIKRKGVICFANHAFSFSPYYLS
jgi:hypothetical protein